MISLGYMDKLKYFYRNKKYQTFIFKFKLCLSNFLNCLRHTIFIYTVVTQNVQTFSIG